MTTLTVANSKGGVGKTTTCMFLASAAQRAGHRVTIIDTDPQGSATEWYEDAREENEELLQGVTLTIGNAATLARLKHDDGITIIDTPPGDPRLLDAAIAAADFVIIPSLPSLRDVPRIWKITETIPATTPAAVLFVSANTAARLPTDAREALESEDVVVFPDNIPQWEAFRQAGEWPQGGQRGTEHYDTVFAQIMEVLS